MSRFRTHYDNLKVARDAPPEVIKAAYRALAQRYHPDVNPSQDAARIMGVLNQAWAVLGDPARKKQHDEWIEEQLIEESIAEATEGLTRQHSKEQQTGRPAADEAAEKPARKNPSQINSLSRLDDWFVTPKGRAFAVACLAMLGSVVWFGVSSGKTTASTERKSQSTTPPLATQAQQPVNVSQVERPQPEARLLPQPSASKKVEEPSATAPPPERWSPNGKPWPKAASYLNGMPRLATGGLSTLTIDNTNGDSNVHAKLCIFGSDRCSGLRNVFIPQGTKFTLNGIAAGAYDVRYRDLSSGVISRSEAISLHQIAEETGTRYSVVRLTLYRVVGGNATFKAVSDEQF